MKQKVLLVALAVVLAALWFNSDFIQSHPQGYKWAYDEDHRNVLAGYHKVHSFADTLPWWHGFIDEAHPSLRPLSSYMFYGMTWLGEAHGYKWDAWLTFGLFAINCLLIAALVYRLARSEVWATLAGVAAAHASAWLPTMRTYHGIPFTWHYLSDNTLLIAFMLPSLVWFLLWRERGHQKYLVLSWCAFVAACLTKEQGYILPLMTLALCFAPLPADCVTAKRATLQAGAMALAAAAFYVFRSLVLVSPHDPPNRAAALVEAASGWLRGMVPPSPYDIVMLMGGADAAKAILCYAAAGYGAYLLWKYRGVVGRDLARPEVASQLKCATLLWLCAMVSYIPAIGFDVAGHRGLLAVMLKCAAGTVALQAVCPLLLKYAHAIRIERPQFRVPAATGD